MYEAKNEGEKWSFDFGQVASGSTLEFYYKNPDYNESDYDHPDYENPEHYSRVSTDDT